MGLEITEEERNLLLELIAGAEDETIRSIDHADSRDFKDVLRSRLDVLTSAKQKIQSYGKQAA